MALTKTKLKESFKKQLDRSSGKKRDTDPRLLNYFDMDAGESMKILLVPDPDGELFYNYKVHGSNMNLRGVNTIRCTYEATGESCAACAISWEHYQNGNKEENKKWISDEKTLGQCVVLDSPIEVKDNPDDNFVKLFYVPAKVKKMIHEALVEEIIDDPTEHILVIKKTKNEGGWNSYENSYFIQKQYQPSKELLEAVDEGFVRPYSYAEMEEKEDLIPKRTTPKEVEEWVDNVERVMKNSSVGATAVKGRVDEPDVEASNDVDDEDDNPLPPEEDKPKKTGINKTLEEKLNRFQRNRKG